MNTLEYLLLEWGSSVSLQKTNLRPMVGMYSEGLLFISERKKERKKIKGKRRKKARRGRKKERKEGREGGRRFSS